MAKGQTVERQRRAFVPDAAWLATQVQEPILEPDLPIVDPHHHLWDHLNQRYLLDELLADTGTGHTITHTVYIDCRSMYRGGGPVETLSTGKLLSNMQRPAPNASMQVAIHGFQASAISREVGGTGRCM